ncbi:MAG: hypothetical protein NT013_17470 [Planctomycetia bacterium]|nr:hypothetical protein [Planctomycetia bacterium]
MKSRTLAMILVLSIVHAAAQPSRSAEPKLFKPISLAPIANRAKIDHLVRPPSGRVTLGEIPFEFPTPHKGFQTEAFNGNDPLSAGIHVNVPRPLAVYVLLSGGYVPREHQGKEVGAIVLEFSDGTEMNVPIKAWVTLRETWSENETIIPPGSDEHAKLVNVLAEDQFRGKKSTAFLDMLVIDLKRSEVGAALSGITIRDTSRKTVNKSGPYAGAPSLVVNGITVEHEPIPEDPRMAVIYKSLKITKPQIVGGPYSPGDLVTVAYELTNSSDAALEVPVDESLPRPFNHVGTRQHWVERQGDDQTIPGIPPQTGRQGSKYAAGGTMILTKATIAARESLPLQQRLSTKGFPAGKYTFYIEYKKFGEGSLQTEKVEFELTDK